MKLSVVIPAHNEEQNVGRCVAELQAVLGGKYGIDHEVIVVDDNSSDGTVRVVEELMRDHAEIRLVRRSPPAGFGRAIRAGLDEVRGDVVAVYMADLSDDPEDLV